MAGKRVSKGVAPAVSSVDAIVRKTHPGPGGNPRHPSVKGKPNAAHHVLPGNRPD